MIEDLDNACHESADPPDAPPPQVIWTVRTGRRGRPRKEIDRQFLANGLRFRGPTGIARSLGREASSRTVRRRAVEKRLSQAGVPVRTTITLPDGTVRHTYTSSTAPVSTLTDNELDDLVADIVQIFPSAGRRMIKGSLKSRGHDVPLKRVGESHARVNGAPGIFGRRAIHRRRYKVAGANSLWHHDGQHGTESFMLRLGSTN